MMTIARHLCGHVAALRNGGAASLVWSFRRAARAAQRLLQLHATAAAARSGGLAARQARPAGSSIWCVPKHLGSAGST
eukprot:359175-Chlamydomonas_euryale.AAC.2